MPLHSLQRLSPTAVLGLWQLTETPDELWQLLPQPPAYRPLMPATADAARQAQWLAGRALIHALPSALLAEPPTDLVVHNDATGRPWRARGTASRCRCRTRALGRRPC
jgi:4'-phosphopantetheinyl transferase